MVERPVGLFGAGNPVSKDRATGIPYRRSWLRQRPISNLHVQIDRIPKNAECD